MFAIFMPSMLCFSLYGCIANELYNNTRVHASTVCFTNFLFNLCTLITVIFFVTVVLDMKVDFLYTQQETVI